VAVQLGVHDADQLLQCCELLLHAALVAEEVALHPTHDLDEAPEGGHFVAAHHDVNGSAEVRHALNIAFGSLEVSSRLLCRLRRCMLTEVFVVKVVREENGCEALDVLVAR
jgi:hypothetical protein